MFTFIITTNRVTKESTKTIEILLKTKLPHDTILIVNYNNYDISYKDIKGIEYKHIKQSKKISLNLSLPKSSNVVILDDIVTISEDFVECLYKHYNFGSLCSLRVDTFSNNGKFVKSDHRIGSTITPKSFTHFAIAFNTSIISKVGDTSEETAIIASNHGVPLILLPNVRVVVPSRKKDITNNTGITLIIPTLDYKFKQSIKQDIQNNDKIYEFDNNNKDLIKFINQIISESSNECIVIINPESKIDSGGMINRIRGLYDNTCILFDTSIKGLSEDAWLVVPKSKYNPSYKNFSKISQIQSHIISYNKDVISYINGHENKNLPSKRVQTNEKILPSKRVQTNEKISIIIPYMHLGDRWPLFESCIDNLYNNIKNQPSIEIVIHECGIERFIDKKFINKYNLVYLFSEYHGLFHRAWCLNVASRFVANGDTLVFFDGDLLANELWVSELLLCDKTKSYVGWGEMINLTKSCTDRYLKTKIISGTQNKSRIPDSYGPAGGINVIPRETFFNIGGWPESYKDMGYGGEDNSLAFKMNKLGIYEGEMNKNIFKSSVYHLFHGHETKRDSSRHPVFDRHFKYDKEDWFEHIRRNYKWGWPVDGTIDLSKSKTYINESLLYVYKNSNKVRLTVCIVNFLRYEKLIRTLTLLSNFNIPLNVVLWINQSDSMSDNIRDAVETILSGFTNHDITYSKKNLGVGYPRHMMNNKAKFEYDTDYIVTMDDDTPHTCVESLVLASTVLDQNEYSEYGAMGIWCDPQFLIVEVVNNAIKKYPSIEGFHTVDCLGSGTMTVRRKVLDDCNYDTQYTMGLEDWDFSLSMRSKGWKLGMVCDPRYKPLNDMRDNSREYVTSRWNQSVIENSRNIFKKKWGISGA